ncbi:MAG: nuclear transport factor 2 family protein [Pseudomonadota bacterium]|uniref:nuclear transport factor 2 family protein n=1 Tax=Polaromonas sp. TaxID=1869339 RepID=UPI00182703CE|nr:nuclear transport factor 2 family protein [Polaromonas sp.]MBA3592699.1 nuclear transport factor 2 family protein [Polaromonas sp.]MDQ3273232.1 nuclear transport factor 2 family protein [Pseudomonadota bacterium]
MRETEQIAAAVTRYAAAWEANDLQTMVDSYHDEVIFHYFGRNPLAGTHRGKAACLAVLRQVRDKTSRKLLAIRDVLVGEHFGAIIAVEQFKHQGKTVVVERLLRYRVQDGNLRECWVCDEDQRLVDDILSGPAPSCAP